MRSPLFWKLFGLQLLAAAVLIGSALGVMRYYTALNFTEFIASQDRERLQGIAADFARVYASSGSLETAAQQVLQGPPRMRRPGPPMDGADNGPPPPPQDGSGPPPGQGFREGPPEGPPLGQQRPPPPNNGQPGRALRILDAQGQLLAGYQHDPPPQGEVQVPVVVRGETVAWIARPRPQGPPQADQQRFAGQQLRGLYAIGGCAMLLAVIIALIVSSLILNPIRRLSEGVAALAQRDFSTRLDIASGDELGRLAADFNRLAEALERYDARQRQWLADIAHELRTPLAILRGELEAIIDGVRALDAAGARSLHQEALRLARLVDDLHLLSLAESGGLVLHRTPMAVAEVVQRSAQRFHERFAARGFKLVVDAKDANLTLPLDPQRIEQLIANLLENALRHASPPGPVSLGAHSDGRQCRIAVSDAGPGVPASALPRLFDRLYRTDAARTRVAGGSGLGLAICRSIAEAHGGRILASRSPQGGLLVELFLPLEPAA